MKLNSRSKGKTAEREVAKILEAWWGQVEPGCKFVPTPLSGGFSTPQIRGDFEMAGDLMTTAQTFPFTIEVKRREGWSEKNLTRGKKSPVWKWWTQTLKAAAEENKFPMLWFRKSREQWRIIVPVQLKKYMNGCTPAIEWEGDIDADYGMFFPICYWVKSK
jgi:Holliday junction resolvase